ncbi:MAG: DUF3810 domain-containing protein [Planctomycetota bacterium]
MQPENPAATPTVSAPAKPSTPQTPRSDAYRPPWIGFTFGLCVAGAALAMGARLSSSRELSERVYGQDYAPVLTHAIASVTGWAPVSVAEILCVVLLITLCSSVWRGIRAWRRGTATMSRILLCGVVRAGGIAALLYAIYLVLWGYQYSRPALATRLAFAPIDQLDTDRLARICGALVDTTNERFLLVHGGSDPGALTELPADLSALDAALDGGWLDVAREFSLPPGAALSYGPVKRPFASMVLSKLGIAGIYFPFTAEANVNRAIPAIDMPHTMAHEKAHQRGFAREDDANFLGYLAADRSDHALARYSAALFAQRQLLGALMSQDHRRATELIARRHPGVQRDIAGEHAFWIQHEGPLKRASGTINNAYLKASGVAQGTRSYEMSVRYLLGYFLDRGG